MQIDKLEQIVYALDLLIERYNGREMSRRNFESFLNEICNFYRDLLQPYCGHLMSQVIIRNELIINLGEVQAECVLQSLGLRRESI